jgi:UDP-N-acetylmuramoyl-L-alanyl-D-glutamate--2,6-diaminopimelate ligase
VALRGTEVDGHRFIDMAIDRGARVVVMEDDLARPDALFMHAGVFKILVPDTRRALARMAANLYHHPSQKLRVIGVTGTNGKTTTTHLIRSILEAAGEQVGLIGTIEYLIGSERLPATHTTPESLELNKMLATMVERGCTSAIMEVSSHGLAMQRVHGLRFRSAVFTNLTQDHLDFHGSMDEYSRAKRLLFGMLDRTAVAVTNAGDPSGMAMVAGTAARILTYNVGGAADVRAEDVRMDVRGLTMSVVTSAGKIPVSSTLTGSFNVANLLAAAGAAIGLGIPEEAITRGIRNLPSVRGRFEQVVSPEGWTAVIDYAHTPDALENVLQTLRTLLPKGGRIITVFGCGGNRDRGKRPIMGRIASTYSDVTIVTSDNPRGEDPGAIIDQILGGIPAGSSVYAEVDRRGAIRRALLQARRGDVVLVAGKGHEEYQIIGERRLHFDDREEVLNYAQGRA